MQMLSENSTCIMSTNDRISMPASGVIRISSLIA